MFTDELVGRTLCSVTQKLSWDGVFVEESTLSKLKKDVEYPQLQDIQIYNIGYNEINSGLSSNHLQRIKKI